VNFMQAQHMYKLASSLPLCEHVLCCQRFVGKFVSICSSPKHVYVLITWQLTTAVISPTFANASSHGENKSWGKLRCD
jgi:hypothetical protein